jgi:hypothetical protein
MRPIQSLAVLALVATASAAAAQTPAPSFTLPQAYSAYSQPAVTDCTAVGSMQRDCFVPAMTAGRYRIVATASATSTSGDANQRLFIRVGKEICAGTGQKAIAFTGKKGFGVVCSVTFLTDQPITVSAIYQVHAATAEANAPHIQIERLPWTGVIAQQAIAGVLNPAPAAK